MIFLCVGKVWSKHWNRVLQPLQFLVFVYRYAPMRFIQSMGSFGFANQFYKSAVQFYYGASKEVSMLACVVCIKLNRFCHYLKALYYYLTIS